MVAASGHDDDAQDDRDVTRMRDDREVGGRTRFLTCPALGGRAAALLTSRFDRQSATAAAAAVRAAQAR